jgi:hypothetical protein
MSSGRNAAVFRPAIAPLLLVQLAGVQPLTESHEALSRIKLGSPQTYPYPSSHAPVVAHTRGIVVPAGSWANIWLYHRSNANVIKLNVLALFSGRPGVPHARPVFVDYVTAYSDIGTRKIGGHVQRLYSGTI